MRRRTQNRLFSTILYNITTDKVEQVFGIGQNFTHLIYVTPDGNQFYTTNVESGTVSIYERKQVPPYMPPIGVLPSNALPRLEWRQSLVYVGYGAEGFDISANGTELWTERPDGYIVIVDLKTKKVKSTINTHIEDLHRLKITPDGKIACIVSVKTNDLLFHNTESFQLKKRMNIGKGAGIYMDKARNRMFISCTPDNYIAMVDLIFKKKRYEKLLLEGLIP